MDRSHKLSKMVRCFGSPSTYFLTHRPSCILISKLVTIRKLSYSKEKATGFFNKDVDLSRLSVQSNSYVIKVQ